MASGVSWLDWKLGFRMLIKYPGLTLIGGLAMAFAVSVGAGSFEYLRQLTGPALPLPAGDRVVGIMNHDAEVGRRVLPTLYDFSLWRELESVAELGAFRTVERNLITGAESGEPLSVAEITASAFQLSRVSPLLGRPIVEADEQPGAASVVVIGYDVWQARFRGDPAVIGRTVRLGSTQATVVGVMPEGFAFPVSHSLWTPLQLNALGYPTGEWPEVRVVGRLDPRVSLEQAQAELSTIGQRAAAEFLETHEHLWPAIMPYAQSIVGLDPAAAWGLRSANLFFVMLLVLVAANVALLMFARAAARELEILVRSALGASRSRIIGQLFIEALVLAGVSAALGLSVAAFALRVWLDVMRAESGGRLPFWFEATLSPSTIVYSVALTVLGAAVAGVLPALKMTRRSPATRLRQASAGGGGLRIGGIWSAVIIAQIAFTVAFPAAGFFVRNEVRQFRFYNVGFPADEYLSVRLEANRAIPAVAPEPDSASQPINSFETSLRELERRLESEPSVAGVTFATRLPRSTHPNRLVEVDADPSGSEDSIGIHSVWTAAVDTDYFQVLGAPTIVGREFRSGDSAAETPVVLVNESFVATLLRGRHPIGRRVRYAAGRGEEPGPWYEIVGVVPDLGMDPVAPAGLYRPIGLGELSSVQMAVHVRGAPAGFVPRLRALATVVDPTLGLYEPLPLNEAGFRRWSEFAFLFRLIVVVSSVALLLSLAGIYAAMSFTVARRTREIGIRIALGANPQRLAAAIFRLPVKQVAIGILAGGVLVSALTFAFLKTSLSLGHAGVIVVYAILMFGVCLLACIVPMRRALEIAPTEAMRAET